MAKKKPKWTILINGEQQSVLKGQAEKERLDPESEEGKKYKYCVRFSIETYPPKSRNANRIAFTIYPRSADEAKLREQEIEELRWKHDEDLSWSPDFFYVRFKNKNKSVYQGESSDKCWHGEEWSAPLEDFEGSWDAVPVADDQTLRITHLGGEPESYKFARVKPRRAETDGRFLNWVYICEGVEIDIKPRQEEICQDAPIENPDYYPAWLMENPSIPRGLPNRVGTDNSWYLARLTNGATVIVYPPEFRHNPVAAQISVTGKEDLSLTNVYDWGSFEFDFDAQIVRNIGTDKEWKLYPGEIKVLRYCRELKSQGKATFNYSDMPDKPQSAKLDAVFSRNRDLKNVLFKNLHHQEFQFLF